jgi:O-antigen/teichoic acid export membrane protein
MADAEETVADRKAGTGDGGGDRSRGAFANAGWNAFSTAWGIAISFLISPVLIHNLGTPHYGTLLLVWSITGVLGVVGFGFGEATLRYVAYHHGAGNIAGVNRVFGSTLSFYIFVCAGILLLLFPFAPAVAAYMKVPPHEQHTVAWLLRIATITFSVGMIASAFAAVPMALQRYDLSSKIGITQNVIRSSGYILLAVFGFGVLHLIVWDLFISLAVLALQTVVARRLIPQARLAPTFSFSGIREILGYSSFSFLTHVFHTMYRESGKLMLGGSGSSSRVAYLGTPESIAYRIYMVIISASETLVPKFSANKDPAAAQNLVANGTWSVIAASATLLIPLTVLMPDFLKLWINAEFAHESSAVGQMMALSFIAPAAFSPLATFFRGSGRPWFVTVVMALVGITVLLGCLLLLPSKGVDGVGIAYVVSSFPWLLGLLLGWLYLFGLSSMPSLIRSAGLPLVLAGVALGLQWFIRGWFGGLTWFGLIGLGASFAALTALGIFGVDFVLGGKSPSRYLLERLGRSSRVSALRRFLPVARSL